MLTRFYQLCTKVFLNYLSTHMQIQFLVGHPLAVIWAFTRAGIPEMYFFKNSSCEDFGSRLM